MTWLSRKIDAWLFARRLETNLKARRAARMNGQVFVAAYNRRK